MNPVKIDTNKLADPSRLEYIDIAKGLLITLVVVGHAWRAVYNNDMLHNTELYHLVDTWIYSFHMPAFFFLSGLFAMQSAQRPVNTFIAVKLRKIVYPYLLWSVAQSALQLLLSGSTTSKITIVDIITIPLVPVMQFWFLYALFFIFLIFILLRQVTTSPLMFLGTGVALFFMIRMGYAPAYPPVTYLANNFIYFAAGIVFSVFIPSIFCKLTSHVRSLILVLIITLFLACIIPWTAGKSVSPINLWLVPLFALPGIGLTLLAALLLQIKSILLAEAFAMLGRRSLEIFVAHTIFSAGFRIAAVKLAGIHILSVQLPGAIFAGLAGPLLLVYLANLFQFRYLFTYPSQQK